MMDKFIFIFVIFGACVAASSGVEVFTNYEISRNKLGYGGGAGYGNYYPGQGGYPGHYPSGPSGPSGPGGYYPGGNHHYGPPGPPGAHPGCPLCDSSVYSYCSHKEAHDACCCGGGSYGYGCRKSDCKFLYANSCQEFNLISSCCCVDLHKNAIASPVVAPIAPLV